MTDPIQVLRDALTDFEAAYFADDEAVIRFPNTLENSRDALAQLEALVEAARAVDETTNSEDWDLKLALAPFKENP